ncbi:glycosyltransferase [Kozakia baliensis]|uniref:Glycosyltransferase subfamily 4-like N-terminal domain-containing protein n=2 Tax=Kozakia baliensis TaxID=153496 RepID=A0A1D8UR94_9PROT|nr:glycosyltransferase [Kozakia baliensis]AOX16150.1 hypothetical protein A0U89_02325 [Kozakia baliensis]GEL65036.1 hypothetical protein KBA01_23220 [Kozakia baliensis]
MKVLVWQWGRRGGGPRFAIDLARGIASLPHHEIVLSLSRQSEFMNLDEVVCDLPVSTYTNIVGLLWRAICAPQLFFSLRKQLKGRGLDLAVCAMPGPLDLIMLGALRSIGVPVVVFVHDAQAHPGDGYPMQIFLQNILIRLADGVAVLSRHVARQLEQSGALHGRVPVLSTLPPSIFHKNFPAPMAHQGAKRFLFFGRLLHYKGLDLLAEALSLLPSDLAFEMRIVGNGPASETLRELARDARVRVENRWVPEDEIPALIAWADVLVLPYREASQSGVAGAAIMANRWAIATRVGGLTEQFADQTQAIICAPTASSIAAAIVEMVRTPPALPPRYDALKAWRNMSRQFLQDCGNLLAAR